MDNMYREFKFETFGDAYIVFKDIFYIGHCKNYITYNDLLETINKYKLKYLVGENNKFIEPQPIKFPNAIKEYGWDEGRDIKIYGPIDSLSNDEEPCILYMPEIKLLNIK